MIFDKNIFNNYERDGFIIIKNSISKKDCLKFYNTCISKILKQQYNINIHNKKTWGKRRELIISEPNNNPISKYPKYTKWNKLFKNNILISFLCSKYKNWNFDSNNLGWIHLRFPFLKKSRSCLNYHLDNTHQIKVKDKLELRLNYNTGPVILLNLKGSKTFSGNNIIVPGSHKIINDYIHTKKCKSLNKIINKISNKNKNIELPLETGDILVMNPQLVHCSSYGNKRSSVRVFFNIPTKLY